MNSRFRDYDLNQRLLLPPDLADWLPEKHLARFVAEVVGEMDLEAIFAACGSGEKGGRPAYHPVMMVRLLLYGYCTGVYSSRKLEARTHEDVAFRFLAGDQHPDHDSIAHFRKRHLVALGELFSQVLQLCVKAGLVKLGHVAVDGSKIKANASKHKAMSYERMQQAEKKLEAELEELKRKVQAMLDKAEQVDAEEDARYGKSKSGDDLPKELARREDRLRVIRKAMAELRKEARAREAGQKAALQAEEGSEAEASDGQRDDDPPPPPPASPDGPTEEAAVQEHESPTVETEQSNAASKSTAVEPGPKAQRNFTDPDSRIMLDGSTKGYIQAYNTQIGVDAEHQVIVSADVVQTPVDNHQLIPVLMGVKDEVGRLPEKVSADTGYYSEANLTDARLQEVDLYVPPARQKHGQSAAAYGHAAVSLTLLTLASFLFCRLPRTRISKASRQFYAYGFTLGMSVTSSLIGGGLFPLRIPSVKDRMRYKLQSAEGHEVYSRRKVIVEPVYGHIKDARGFREFSLRGHQGVRSEFRFVSAAHNLLKLFKSWIRQKGPIALAAIG